METFPEKEGEIRSEPGKIEEIRGEMLPFFIEAGIINKYNYVELVLLYNLKMPY